MYASKRYITALTLSLIDATFKSTLDNISASLIACVVGDNGCLDSANVSNLFYSSRSEILDPIVITRFFRAWASDMEAGPVRVADSSSFRRLRCASCSLLCLLSYAKYSLPLVVNY
jgi:hypothetical protein